MNVSSRATQPVGVAVAIVLAFHLSAGVMFADDVTLRLRATVIGAGAPAAALTVELFRWSSDAERTPLLSALTAPPPSPPTPTDGRAGRGGRGGRGAAPPPSPLARLTAAIKAAPTVGFIWSDGVTGFSIKYAWHSKLAGNVERIVLVTDRRLGVQTSLPRPASGGAADAEFTVLEMRLDAKGTGEAKASLTSDVMVDGVAKTLALDGYDAAPVLLKVTR